MRIHTNITWKPIDQFYYSANSTIIKISREVKYIHAASESSKPETNHPPIEVATWSARSSAAIPGFMEKPYVRFPQPLPALKPSCSTTAAGARSGADSTIPMPASPCGSVPPAAANRWTTVGLPGGLSGRSPCGGVCLTRTPALTGCSTARGTACPGWCATATIKPRCWFLTAKQPAVSGTRKASQPGWRICSGWKRCTSAPGMGADPRRPGCTGLPLTCRSISTNTGSGLQPTWSAARRPVSTSTSVRTANGLEGFAPGKRVLNLFGYSGAFSVYAGLNRSRNTSQPSMLPGPPWTPPAITGA